VSEKFLRQRGEGRERALDLGGADVAVGDQAQQRLAPRGGVHAVLSERGDPLGRGAAAPADVDLTMLSRRAPDRPDARLMRCSPSASARATR